MSCSNLISVLRVLRALPEGHTRAVATTPAPYAGTKPTAALPIVHRAIASSVAILVHILHA
ncbi:MAG: hypothetical protein ACXW4U_11875, partial [Anaerolineales bacterium]